MGQNNDENQTYFYAYNIQEENSEGFDFTISQFIMFLISFLIFTSIWDTKGFISAFLSLIAGILLFYTLKIIVLEYKLSKARENNAIRKNLGITNYAVPENILSYSKKREINSILDHTEKAIMNNR